MKRTEGKNRYIILFFMCLVMIIGIAMFGNQQSGIEKNLTAIFLPSGYAEDNGDIIVTAEWSDDYASIGHPITLHYELNGGSGEFPEVTVQALYEHGTGMSYGGDVKRTNTGNADCELIPQDGKTLSVQIYGKDSEDRSFYLQVDTIPIHSNPDYPVHVTYSGEPVMVGETLTALYSIDGCDSFSGEISWVVKDQEGYHNGIQKETISEPVGSIMFTPQYGEIVYFELKGSTGEGHPVYFESEPVTVEGASVVEPIIVTHSWSEQTAAIGHPITLHYELSGGSGEFPQVTVQILYEHGNGGGTSYGGDQQHTNAQADDCVIVPKEGKRLCVQIYGYDSSERSFYIDLPYILIGPNPDLPVNCVYNCDSIRLGEELVLSYNIGNCDTFTGSSRWVIMDDNGYNPGNLTGGLDSPDGIIRYTPQYGNAVFFEIQGVTGEGAYVYCESEPVAISTEGPSVIAEGFCGAAITWTLDDAGVLRITGTGEMFDYSTGTAPWYNRREDITSIVVEDGVKYLGNYSFENCDHLVSLTLPESVQGFGFYAICGCENLEELLIPGDINRLGNHAIYDCEKLHVSLYQRGSFILSQFREYNIPFTVLDADSDYIYFEGSRTIRAYLGSDPVVSIPEGVTRIYYDAFSYIDEIETVIIPESVAKIEGYAFKNCTSLKNVSLPPTLTYLGEEAFEGCSSLESITIPSNLNCLEWSAFSQCSGLREIHLSLNFLKVSGNVFNGCSALTDVYYEGMESDRESIIIDEGNEYLINATWHYDADQGNIIWSLNNGTLTISGTGTMENYESEEPAPWQDRREEIASVFIEEGVTSIGEYAFYDCNHLQNVIMMDSVTSIGSNAFRDCTVLANVILSGGLTEIEDSAFEGCLNLSSIMLPASLQRIGYCAFTACSLSGISIPDGAGTKTWDFFYPDYDGSCNLYHISLPSNITEVGYGAFCYNRFKHDTPDFILPAGLKNIESEAFYKTNFKYVWLSDELEMIGDAAFNVSVGLQYVYVPYTVTVIGENAFSESTILMGISGYDKPCLAEIYAEEHGLTFLDLEDPYGGNG